MAYKQQTRKMNTVESNVRRLEDLHISGGGSGTWSLVEDWFESEEAEFSVPFTIKESFEYQDGSQRKKVGFTIVMEGEDSDEVDYCISFPATDKKGEPHKERQKLFQLLQDDSTPIAGCVMQRVDVGQDHPFIKIISVEAMERIITSETDDNEPF